jgi:hypothetical protein
MASIKGNPVATGQTRPGKLLAMDSGLASGAIDGEATREPAFGLEAWWIDAALRTRAETMNYTVVDPTSVLGTHLTEVVRQHHPQVTKLEFLVAGRHVRLKQPIRHSRLQFGDVNEALGRTQSEILARLPGTIGESRATAERPFVIDGAASVF